MRETGRDESQSVPLPRETLQNKRFRAPKVLGILPKLLAALRGIHPYLSTPVLPRGQFSVLARIKGCLSPAETTKTLENTRENGDLILTKEIPCLKLTKAFQKNKERKDRAGSAERLRGEFFSSRGGTSGAFGKPCFCPLPKKGPL